MTLTPDQHDSTPAMPITATQKVRFGQTATDLDDARIQDYIQANFGTEALKVIQAVLPILTRLARL